MKKPLLNSQRALVLVIGLMVICTLLPAWASAAVVSRPQDLVRAALGPATWVLMSMSNTLRPRRQTPQVPSADSRAEDYHQALQIIRKMESELEAARRQIVDLTALSGVLGSATARPVTASVTAYTADRQNQLLTITLGTRTGVTDGLAVVYSSSRSASLVGRVVQAGPLTAYVRLITDPKMNLGVRIVPPVPGSVPRELNTRIVPGPDRQRFVTDEDINDPVQVNDLAHLNDDGWPPEARGFVVGRVVEDRTLASDPLQFKRLVIEPIETLEKLSRVYVLVPVNSR